METAFLCPCLGMKPRRFQVTERCRGNMQHAHICKPHNEWTKSLLPLCNVAVLWLYISLKNKKSTTRWTVHHTTSHYAAQFGLYTMTGRWYAFSGSFGRGVTSGDGVVSCRTTSACLRWSLRLCAGDRHP